MAAVLTTREAAAYCGYERKTFYNLRSAGLAPKAFKHGRLTVYYEADLDAWLEGRLIPA
jgi:predicted DNA-binding transcriptional regulator AlpA